MVTQGARFIFIKNFIFHNKIGFMLEPRDNGYKRFQEFLSSFHVKCPHFTCNMSQRAHHVAYSIWEYVSCSLTISNQKNKNDMQWIHIGKNKENPKNQ